MVCQLCRSRQVAAIVKTDEGSASLCAECFQRYRLYTDLGQIDGLADFFFMFDEYNPIAAYVKNTQKVCPVCGSSLNSIEEDFKFGCSKCYEYFADKADGYFYELGGKEYQGRYVGYENRKKGRRLSDMTVDDLPFLLKKLQEAKDNGEASRADAIDKRIRQLKGGKK